MSFSKEKKESIKEYILEQIGKNIAVPEIVNKATEAFRISKNTVYRYLRELSGQKIIIQKDGKRYALDANVDGGFTRTRIPIKNLFQTYPVSRSQAKRLTGRLESFEEVELDFSDVPEIGQGFAHELFVVFPGKHPEVKLIPFNTSLDVQRMIYHVTKG